MLPKKNLFLLSVVVLFCGLRESYGVFWPCESNDDCTAEGSKCSLDTYECECEDFESIFSEDFTKCLKTSLIGDTCEDSVQCNLMPSGANCKSGVCDCADGHTYVHGRCRPLNGLDQNCETDLDCYFAYDRESVKCQDRVCQCADEYYRRHGNICRRKSMEIGDACVVHTDCDNLGSDTQCIDLKCTSTSSSSSTTAETTKEPTSATNTPATETTVNIETTDTTTFSTTVISTTLTTSATAETISTEVGSTETNSPTTETSFTNNDSTGTSTPTTEISSTGFHSDFRARSLNSQEHLILVNGENSDSTDDDDQILSEIEVKKDETRQILSNFNNRIKSREIAVQTSIDAFELKDLPRKFKNVGTATASTSTSSRHTYNKRRRQRPFRFEEDDIKTFSTLSNTDDDADEQKYGSSCTENGKSCSGLPHSLCSNNICFCKQGYYRRNGKCFAELGEIAESEDACEFEFQRATKKCICQKNYFYERSLRGCRKPIQYHLSCTSNSQCSPYGAAFCHPIIPRRCTCEEFAEYDALQQLCIYKQGLGSECDRNEGCPVPNSICSNRTCVCAETYFEKDGACVNGIGADCLNDTDCILENSVCEQKSPVRDSSDEEEQKEKSCQCRKGFVHFKDECLKEAEEIDDECIENEQCKPLLASCVNKECKCSAQQHFKNGRCETKKEIGEACSRATECFVEKDPENIECRNSVCQCKVGYQVDGGQRTCIRVMPNKKNSSGRPSALKIITFVLIGSAFLITSAAIKQAYYY